MSDESRDGRLDGRVALVSGAGRGIGLAIARALAARTLCIGSQRCTSVP